MPIVRFIYGIIALGFILCHAYAADLPGWKLVWSDEIDIMEHVGFDPSVIHGTLYTEAYNHMKKSQRATQIKLPTFSKNFHTYTTEWSADKIVMQIDGKTFATYNNKPGDKEAEWPFDKPYYLILNLAIGGGWGGMKGIDDTAFPQRFEVDYVRVYQK